ncbi:MAG: SpaA isopeptide-forming pilin-related protein [Intestinibaculum porci]|uniref:SpaA isopeptide-forming pilin-related protein n=1 Tax=Intestinibaculum porci TaxID=2487118 RepID=UPI003F0E9CEF
MKKYRYTALLTFIISLMMVVSVVFPTVASAEDSMTSSATQETTHQDTAEQLTAQDTADELTKKDTADQLTASSPAFTTEKTLDGVKVKVSADANVFPEGTTMEVKKVTLSTADKKLISKKQEDDQTAIRQYSFDITMKNKDGEEIEPDTSKGKVKVTFENELVKNFTTNVYHLDDNKKVDKLKLTKSKDQVTGETTGFSTYLLELTVDSSVSITIAFIKNVDENDKINLSEKLTKMLGLTDSTKVERIDATNQADFQTYGTLEKKNNEYYLLLTKVIPNELLFSVKISGSSNSLNLHVRASDPYTGENEWLNNYRTQKNDNTHTINLLKYRLLDNAEEEKNITIPKSVKINGVEYNIEISGSVFNGVQSIESVIFEKGVKADTSLSSLFAGDKNLKSVDLSGLDTSNTRNMSSMFANCSSLNYDGIKFATKDADSLFTTENVENMSLMFSNMTNLTKFDLSSFKTNSLTDMASMFSNDKALKEVNISNLKGAPSKTLYEQSKGYDSNDIKEFMAPYSAPFNGCENLETIILGDQWQGFSVDRTNGIIYLPLGINDSWQNQTTFKIYTSEQLDDSFDASTMAGTYKRVNVAGADPQYEANGSLYGNNIWEVHNPSQSFHGFCLNQGKHYPKGYYDKVQLDTYGNQQTGTSNGHSNYIGDYISSNSGSEYIGGKNPTMAKALIALIYYSKNPIDKEKHILSEEEVQQLIWLFTDQYSEISNSDYTFKTNSIYYKYVHSTQTFHFYDASSGKEKYSFNLNECNYDQIKSPDGSSYRLFIYSPSSDNTADVQNLLSIEGAATDVRAGVQVKKVDQHGNPVVGAKFGIYKKGQEKLGDEFATFETNSKGYGGLYGMDKSTGLPVGDYVVKEISAPNGYTINKTPYYFSVGNNDDQVLKLVGDGDGDSKTIVDQKDETFKGAGLKIYKRDENGNALVGAEFKIYEKSSGESTAKTYITDSNGKIETGPTELVVGKTYIIKETKAPTGFSIADEEEVTVSDSEVGTYIIKTITDKAKTGTVNISATKKLIGSNGKSVDLTKGEFTFGLYDSDGSDAKPIVNSKGEAITATNDATNDSKVNIQFTDVPVNPNGSDTVTYYIKEIKPTTPENGIDYDTHSEKVTISVTENEKGELVCTPSYDSDGAVFTNTQNITYKYQGQLTINKKVTGYPVSTNDKFNFKVYITSPVADLADKLKENNTDTSQDNDFKVLIGSNNETDSFIKSLVKIGTDDNTNLTTYVGAIQLKKDQTCEITGLPTKSGDLATPTFKVVEDEYTYYETSSQVKSESKTTTADGRTVTGDITSTNTEITFTNNGKFIVPTSADTFTRSPFWITIALGALVVIYIKKRKKKLNDK